jgi:hypothetical protein
MSARNCAEFHTDSSTSEHSSIATSLIRCPSPRIERGEAGRQNSTLSFRKVIFEFASSVTAPRVNSERARSSCASSIRSRAEDSAAAITTHRAPGSRKAIQIARQTASVDLPVRLGAAQAVMNFLDAAAFFCPFHNRTPRTAEQKYGKSVTSRCRSRPLLAFIVRLLARYCAGDVGGERQSCSSFRRCVCSRRG